MKPRRFLVARFVSHTNGTQTIDGSTGRNNKMERGDSVVANPIWEPAQPNSPRQRFDTPKVEPSKPQPDLRGHNAAPHTKRP